MIMTLSVMTCAERLGTTWGGEVPRGFATAARASRRGSKAASPEQ